MSKEIVSSGAESVNKLNDEQLDIDFILNSPNSENDFHCFDFHSKKFSSIAMTMNKANELK